MKYSQNYKYFFDKTLRFAMKKTLIPVIIITILSRFLFLYQLGERSLYNPDEGRYAEIAKEMVLRNDFIEPRLYNVDYLAKPILFYWLLIVSFKLFGITELTARLVPALFGFLGILITYWFVNRKINQKAAVYSSLIMATNFWYLQVGRFLVIDMVFTFFILCSLIFFYSAITAEKEKSFFYILFYISLAFAFLAKGFACFFLTGIPIGFYLLFTKQIKKSSQLKYHFFGITVFLALIGIWMIQISIREPDFLKSFIIHEHLKRFMSNDYEHQRPFYFFLLLVPLFCSPWTFFIGPLKQFFSNWKNKNSDLKLFLVLCVLGIISFFSISKTKLPTYCLPVLPFIFILMGYAWSETSEQNYSRKLTFTGIIIFAVTAVGAIIAAVLFYPLYNELYPIKDDLLYLGITVLIGTAVCFVFYRRNKIEFIFYTLVIIMFLTTFPVNSAVKKIIDLNYTTKYFASELKPLLQKEDIVFIYGNPSRFYDFQFYLDHQVTLVGLLGELKPNEYTNIDEEDEDINVIDPEKFKKMFKGKKNVLLFNEKKIF
ncbi:glycosyltransferase family 39 protein [bacterium]|nr:glycosyltransferase family 39 protein [bacterium]